MLKNLLVTGGAGFIGSNFVRYVLEKEPDVQVWTLDALTYAGSLVNLRDLPGEARHTFVEGDICDQARVAALLQENSITTIIHFAAESHVDRSIHGPATFVRTNIEGTFSMLEAAREVWQGNAFPVEEARFLHISTDEVYGSLGPEDPPFRETTAYAPNSPYAASKAASDHLIRAYRHTYGLPTLIAISSNNYGPHQFPEKLMPLMILSALNGRQLPVYGDGGQIRDWLYVGDHCAALHRVLREGEIGETYNIGGDNQSTNLEIVEMICQVLDELLVQSQHTPHRSLIQFVKDRPGHDQRYAMDIGKIVRELGWRPEVGLLAGLQATVRWYLGHSGWLEQIFQEKGYQDWLAVNYGGRG